MSAETRVIIVTGSAEFNNFGENNVFMLRIDNS